MSKKKIKSDKNQTKNQPDQQETMTQEEPKESQATDNLSSSKELESVKNELETEKERYLRLFAEFENYKRRTNKERIELFKTAGQEVMIAMLPVLDDFDRALVELQKSEDDSLFQGITLIHNKLKETLKNKGLTAIEIKSGDTFDADQHEAITQAPAPSDKLKGKIMDVVEKGYALGDKIIRYPKVVIGQ